jgi:c-di-GMP-binding flagellar brake protein YcgR
MNLLTGDLHRRQYVRVEVSLPVEFSVENERATHDGSVFDLGAGGMRLVASYDLPPRANVNLKFRLPAAERNISARGRVILSFFQRSEQKFHHGIAFTSLDPKDRLVIAEFVDHQDAQRDA